MGYVRMYVRTHRIRFQREEENYARKCLFSFDERTGEDDVGGRSGDLIDAYSYDQLKKVHARLRFPRGT